MALRSINNPIASFIDYLTKTGTDASNEVLPPSGLTATGGVISEYTDPGSGNIYRAHIFTSSGTFQVDSIGAYGSNVEYLVVAGGGSGGPGSGGPSAAGGGGGAGGLLSNHPGIPTPLRQPSYSVSSGLYTVTIGAGGAPATDVTGNNGGVSNFFPTPVSYPSPTYIRSFGGGGGGNGASPLSPQTSGVVGSGGGGDYTAGGGSTPGQGNPGGAGIGAPTYRGGGGGGAGAPGTSQSGPSTPAPGGDGLPVAIESATAKYYAGGGGAGSWTGNGNPVGLGGLGGGGKGGSPSIPGAENGTYATGGGGGGGPNVSTSGGSGIVVIRYQIGQLTAASKATGGAISYYGGKTIHTFTSTGTFTVTNPSLTSIEYVVVGGGGAGGGNHPGSPADPGVGGGGAGGYRSGTNYPISSSPGSYSIQVGAGAGSRLSPAGTPSKVYQGASTLIEGSGGGSGSSIYPPGSGNPGGSGGGGTAASSGSSIPSPDGISPTSQGFTASNPSTSNGSSGGGGAGGLGSAGADPGPWPSVYAGGGGIGVQLPATFRNPAAPIGMPGPGGGGYWVGGGGGGARREGPPPGSNPGFRYGRGGYGSSGDGSNFSSDTPIGYAGGGNGAPNAFGVAGNGIENTGGGGGGGKTYGFGGSGIVLIAYPS